MEPRSKLLTRTPSLTTAKKSPEVPNLGVKGQTNGWSTSTPQGERHIHRKKSMELRLTQTPSLTSRTRKMDGDQDLVSLTLTTACLHRTQHETGGNLWKLGKTNATEHRLLTYPTADPGEIRRTHGVKDKTQTGNVPPLGGPSLRNLKGEGLEAQSFWHECRKQAGGW